MPIIKAPEVADVTIWAGVGDVCFESARNSVTGVVDTFLITLVEPGEIGDPDATGRTEGLIDRDRPADVALRFSSRRSIESFVLAAAELLGGARSDVATGDSLGVPD